jgi:hypothetical protein
MSKDRARSGILALFEVHRMSYKGVRSGGWKRRQLSLVVLLPLLSSVITALFGIRIAEPIAVGLLTVLGLMSALLFGVMIQVAQRAQEWADSRPTPGHRTSLYGEFLRELMGNAGWASLVALIASASYVWVVASKGIVLQAASDVAILLSVYLIVLLFRVMASVFQLTDERIRAATTGADLIGAREQDLPLCGSDMD